jgi:hypothetical protein
VVARDLLQALRRNDEVTISVIAAPAKTMGCPDAAATQFANRVKFFVVIGVFLMLWRASAIGAKVGSRSRERSFVS